MAKYTEKPVVVEAFQWLGANEEELTDWLVSNNLVTDCTFNPDNTVTITNTSGTYTIKVNDFIVQDDLTRVKDSIVNYEKEVKETLGVACKVKENWIKREMESNVYDIDGVIGMLQHYEDYGFYKDAEDYLEDTNSFYDDFLYLTSGHPEHIQYINKILKEELI